MTLKMHPDMFIVDEMTQVLTALEFSHQLRKASIMQRVPAILLKA